MRHPVEIQSVSESAGALGDVVQTWTTIATRRAAIIPKTSREFTQGDQTQAEITHEIRMRYFPGLTAKHRLRYGTRIFRIATPPRDVRELRHEHLLECVEEVDS